MDTQDAIFAGDEPVSIIRRWLGEAEALEPSDANAAALATVDADGMPNVRVVLLKEILEDGVVFYTNFESAKGEELAANPCAAFVIHWKSLKRQIRARGTITREDGARADAYYASRPLGSRHGAWASQQSRPLESRDVLSAEIQAIAQEKGDDPARPAHWGGYRLTFSEVELWADGAYRLHDRFRWTKDAASGWRSARLYP